MVKVGALTFAFGEPRYQLMAALQADSWRYHEIPCTVVVDRKPLPFLVDSGANIVLLDQHITMPFEFERYALDLSPYQLTIKTDADVMIPRTWRGLPPWAHELSFVSGIPVTFAGAPVRSSPYRKAWTAQGLPEVHTAICTFTKCAETTALFGIIGNVFDTFYTSDLCNFDRVPSTDLVYSIAYALQGEGVGLGIPFHHMKRGTSGATRGSDNWINQISVTEDLGGNLYLNGLRVDLPFHYYDKRFVDLPLRLIQGQPDGNKQASG